MNRADIVTMQVFGFGRNGTDYMWGLEWGRDLTDLNNAVHGSVLTIRPSLGMAAQVFNGHDLFESPGRCHSHDMPRY
ncbi:hypothetical protein PoB_003780200 [Plakobranchus ocellatus]|uniref:Uncharacterized protein n=1 Tax=Plakobranchus ocellatus TaxID=259542 RepID=A0AAV4AWI4_9GAST|nr:hypothetical protein PoB_003780200 [Plakobranchus ocellatus]